MRVIERYVELPSTNDEASRSPVGTVVIAERQTAGRGRFGRRWHSPRGGLWMSVHLRPRRLEWLTAAAALAAREAAQAVAGVEAGIRFPNDLVVGDRKLCGILIESRPPTAVVGIGLNVNVPSFPPDLEATSLQLETGKTFDLEETAQAVLGALDRWVEVGPREIRRTYIRHNAVVGRRVMINNNLGGIVRSVDPVDGITLTDGRAVSGPHIRELTILPRT